MLIEVQCRVHRRFLDFLRRISQISYDLKVFVPFTFELSVKSCTKSTNLFFHVIQFNFSINSSYLTKCLTNTYTHTAD